MSTPKPRALPGSCSGEFCGFSPSPFNGVSLHPVCQTGGCSGALSARFPGRRKMPRCLSLYWLFQPPPHLTLHPLPGSGRDPRRFTSLLLDCYRPVSGPGPEGERLTPRPGGPSLPTESGSEGARCGERVMGRKGQRCETSRKPPVSSLSRAGHGCLASRAPRGSPAPPRGKQQLPISRPSGFLG